MPSIPYVKKRWGHIWELDTWFKESMGGEGTAATACTDDLRFPSTGINPPGQASDPDRDVTYGAWLFDAASTEVIAVNGQMPHSWKQGTAIIPHVHWQKTTSASGNVLWRLEYIIAPIGEAMSTSFTTLDATTTVAGTPDNNTANEHLITSFGSVDMTGYEISDMIICKVSRIGGDASDTYGADARLLEFDIHYTLDGIGSLAQFSKG